MSDAPEGYEPPNLRFLRRLVTLLTATMIVGLLTIIALLVIRLGQPGAPPFPDAIALPGGATATNVTQGPDWYGVVTEDNRFLIFDRASGALRQTVTIEAWN